MYLFISLFYIRMLHLRNYISEGFAGNFSRHNVQMLCFDRYSIYIIHTYAQIVKTFLIDGPGGCFLLAFIFLNQ